MEAESYLRVSPKSGRQKAKAKAWEKVKGGAPPE